MSHLEHMLERLPQLYREGKLLEQILAISGLSLEVFDEQMLETQRSHWFDTAYDFNDAAMLAAILDITPETWQGIHEFRAWVHSLRNAWLRNGTATREPLQMFVDEYTRRFQAAVSINAVTTLGNWSETPSEIHPALVENPKLRRFQRIPKNGSVEPLHQEALINLGLDDSIADIFLVGSAAGTEYMPAIINTTNGNTLVYTGVIAPGQRLWLQAFSDGTVKAYTDKKDVSEKLYSIEKVLPGQAWSSDQVQQPAQALNILKGDNNLWFLPLAHFNEPGLDRALYSLAELSLQQGRWNETGFDQSLFYQEPVMDLWLSWKESQPASFNITLPGGILINPQGKTEKALENRGRLQFSLNLGIQKLKAAGVAAKTTLLNFSEIQGSRDALSDIYPKQFREMGSTGIDSLPDSGGVFNVTEYEDSVFR